MENRNNGCHPMNVRLLPLVLSLVTTALHAENWSNWRGPLHNGSSPEKNLPASFSKTEGVKWSVEMPGASAATPVIWGDRVFATAADPKTKKQSALCLDRRTGALLWRAEISEFTTDGQYSNSCSPSPVTDGQLAVFFFGTGDLVANGRIDQGNLAIFLNAVNWTVDRDRQLSIPPRPVEKFQLTLSAADFARLRYTVLLGVPGAALLLGLLVYWTRRS